MAWSRPPGGPAPDFWRRSGTTAGKGRRAENLSRCLELTLDDSATQTARVQEAQREAWAGEAREAVDVELWRDAQRVLEALEVVIPFAAELRFPARTSHDRRGNQKLLGLVAAHALLYQRQRGRDDQDRVVATLADYAAVYALVRAAVRVDQDRVVATLADYAAVYALVRAAVRVDLGGLSPRAARAYASLSAGRALTRRELASAQGWAYNTSNNALVELTRQELAHAVSKRAPARYALVDRSLLGDTGALLDPTELEQLTPAPKPKRRPSRKKAA